MTKEELKNQIIELKENCKKLAEEYREKYNQDNENKIALNMFYHNVISYNDYESVLALIENRNSMIMCFSAPPVLTEETVEINLKRIAKQEELLNSTLEENKEIYKKMADLDTALEDCTESLTDARIKIKELEKENSELKERNAKLKGMYTHSAREAGTYKQFLELKEKENAELQDKLNNLASVAEVRLANWQKYETQCH